MSNLDFQNINYRKTIEAILNNSHEFDENHPNFKSHMDNLEYLYKKGIVFISDKTGDYMISREDLLTFKRLDYKTPQEASYIRDEKRMFIQYLTFLFATTSFIASIVIPFLAFVFDLLKKGF